MPLSFVIARYFAYAFAAVATAWLASFPEHALELVAHAETAP